MGSFRNKILSGNLLSLVIGLGLMDRVGERVFCSDPGLVEQAMPLVYPFSFGLLCLSSLFNTFL